MNRRMLLGLAFATAPLAAFAQPAAPPAAPPGARPGWRGPRRGEHHDEVLGRDYDTLPPGAKERVAGAFRQATPGLDEAAIRQRWDSMSPAQRGEVLTMHEMRGGRGMRGGMGGPGAGPGPGRGVPGQAPWQGPGPRRPVPPATPPAPG
jgi:hypothetical protein